jgi:hypothetical protein
MAPGGDRRCCSEGSRADEADRLSKTAGSALEADNPQFRLSAVEARKGSVVLRCTFSGHQDDKIDLTATNAC